MARMQLTVGDRLAILHRAERRRKRVEELALEKQALAGAIREALQRGWQERVFYYTHGQLYTVAGRDRDGIFHFGSATESWQAAFQDADRRAQEGILA